MLYIIITIVLTRAAVRAPVGPC